MRTVLMDPTFIPIIEGDAAARKKKFEELVWWKKSRTEAGVNINADEMLDKVVQLTG